jgi:hypothetical protein
MHCPSRNNEKVKWECSRLGFDDTRFRVDNDYFGHQDSCIFLAPQNMPDGPSDIGGRERSSCYLVNQWLKTMIVMAINNRDLDRRMAQPFRRLKSSEACPKDDNSTTLPRYHWRAHAELGACSFGPVIAKPSF